MGWLSSLGGALGGFVGLGDLGSAIGGGLDYAQQRKDAKKSDMRAFNQALYMSNTAHQREVADLRAAGLNPVLSAMGGSGASTPALQTHGVTDQGTEASSRAQLKREQEQFDKQLEEQSRVNDSVVDKNAADAEAARASARLADANSAKTVSETFPYELNLGLFNTKQGKLFSEGLSARYKSELDRYERDYWKSMTPSQRGALMQLNMHGSSALQVLGAQVLRGVMGVENYGKKLMKKDVLPSGLRQQLKRTGGIMPAVGGIY